MPNQSGSTLPPESARAVGGLPYLLDQLTIKRKARQVAKPAKDPSEENKNQPAPEKQKALDTALAQIERQFGKGSVIKMSEKTSQPIEVIPTGSIALDVASELADFHAEELLKSLDLNPQVKQLLLSTQSLTPKELAVSLHLSMLNMPSMLNTQRN